MFKILRWWVAHQKYLLWGWTGQSWRSLDSLCSWNLHLSSSKLKEPQRFYWLNRRVTLQRHQQSASQRCPRCWLERWWTGEWRRTVWQHTPAQHCFHSENLWEISWFQPEDLKLQILGEKDRKHSRVFAGLIGNLLLFSTSLTWDAYGLLCGWEAAMKSFAFQKLQLFPLTGGNHQTAD